MLTPLWQRRKTDHEKELGAATDIDIAAIELQGGGQSPQC
jgi:hypothetical protein